MQLLNGLKEKHKNSWFAHPHEHHLFFPANLLTKFTILIKDEIFKETYIQQNEQKKK